jgi:hypothetical protein
MSNFIDKQWQSFQQLPHVAPTRQSGRKTRVLGHQCGVKVTLHTNRIMTARFRGKRDATLLAIG